MNDLILKTATGHPEHFSPWRSLGHFSALSARPRIRSSEVIARAEAEGDAWPSAPQPRGNSHINATPGCGDRHGNGVVRDTGRSTCDRCR